MKNNKEMVSTERTTAALGYLQTVLEVIHGPVNLLSFSVKSSDGYDRKKHLTLYEISGEFETAKLNRLDEAVKMKFGANLIADQSHQRLDHDTRHIINIANGDDMHCYVIWYRLESNDLQIGDGRTPVWFAGTSANNRWTEPYFGYQGEHGLIFDI